MLFGKTFSSLIFFLSLCTSFFAQSNFEGKVVLRISEDEITDINYFVKGENIRMEMSADENKIVILFNQKNNKIIMLMSDQNMYMELDGDQYMPYMDNPDEETGDIIRTGEFESINGYKCEKWIIKDEENTIEAWMTDELGNFYMIMNPLDETAQNEWQQKLHGNFFPMKVMEMENDENISTMEVLSVDKTSLKSDLFKVPKGMQKFEMPGMDMNKQN